jgi:hypothetical protein
LKEEEEGEWCKDTLAGGQGLSKAVTNDKIDAKTGSFESFSIKCSIAFSISLKYSTNLTTSFSPKSL